MVKPVKMETQVRQIHEQMGFNDIEDTRRAIGRVMHVIRDTLSDKDANKLSFLLPNDLLVIYLSAWPYKAPKGELKHLDQLVKAVDVEDRSKKNSVFNTEIDILKCVLLVIKHLDREVDIIDKLPITLQQEIRGALIESAA